MQISGSTAAGGTTTATSAGAGQELNRDDFMKLLLTEFQNQNPLSPISDAEFMGQLAQFSTLDSLDKLNTGFQSMLLVQQMAQGAQLIGRSVQYTTGGGTAQEGVVESVQVQGSKVSLLVKGQSVPLDQVQGIKSVAS